ncbi:ankyrin repeat-containing protein BDA1-like [Syzygium oleosum]|uniref:ankyrin repeat-containing protein BDA1-like n=1 Tax=Syzygium oleosum TaxID=219896 RepID=UPI0024B8F398|nr:ankyrin repeat-containing protein BDA1-like [Syzygium oleosum]
MERFLAAGNIDELNDLIRKDGLILEKMALEGAGHTPLHVACVAGHLDLVRVLRKWRPKFAEKVDADGFSPLHIAAARGDVEIARELLEVGRHLCSVEGLEQRIPLYYAIVNGELDVMKELLSDLPESVEKTTARKETALHLAVKNNRFEAVRVLVEHLKDYNCAPVINQQDNEGNTALHLAVAIQNFEVVDFMLSQRHVVVDVNVCNNSSRTPLDFSQREAGDREIRAILTKAGARHGTRRSVSPASPQVLEEDQSDGDAPLSLSRPPLRTLNREKESRGDVRNSLLVVAALIANATYQTVLQPPQFTTEVNNTSTKGFLASYAFWMTGSLGRDLAYILFISGNTFGLLVSVQMIICLTRDLPVKLPMLLSVTAMVQTYYCYTYYLPFKSLGKEYGLKNVELLCVLPLTAPILLLLIQRRLALALNFYLEGLSRLDFLGDMYRLKT